MLEVGGFDVDRGTELHINVQEHDIGEEASMLIERDTTVEAFKECGEGVRTMGPKQEYFINKLQSNTETNKNGRRTERHLAKTDESVVRPVGEYR